MADESRDEQRPDPGSAAARSMTQFAQQLREMADRMMTGGMAWPGLPTAPPGGAGASGSAAPAPAGGTSSGGQRRPATPPASALSAFPASPARLSAQQLQAVVDDIAARRSQVQALQGQLATFDEQLASLESNLRPILEWLRTWTDIEGAVTDFWKPRGGKS
jgi:hypothetical protein